MRGNIMLKWNLFSTIISIAVVAITFIVSSGIVEHKKVLAMSQAVSEASNKGINPIAVRCAFAKSEDNICIVYAAKNPTIQFEKDK
jgi:hypothetical protein